MVELKLTAESVEDLKQQMSAFLSDSDEAPAKSEAKKTPTKKTPTKKEPEFTSEDLTLDDIRKVMAEAREADEDKNVPLLKKILTKYKVVKISELDESDYPAVHEAITALL